MALNLNAIGQEIGPLRREYTWKDVILYALAVGAGFDELHYCYEKHLKVLPSYPLAAVMDFFWQVAAMANINPVGVLHGEQTLIVHNAIPSEGVFVTSGQITHIYDKGKNKGALVEAVSDTEDGNGRRLITSGITLFARLDGGFGGHDRPSKRIPFPDGQPDIVIKDTPLNSQPLLYRLTGEAVITHGVCCYK